MIPDRLHDHLRKLHGHGRVDPLLRAEYVDGSRDEVEHLAQDVGLVRGEVGGKLESREVGLKEDVGLEVRREVVGLCRLDRYPIVDLAQKFLLPVPQRDRLELLRGRDDLENALELGFLRQAHAEDVGRDVVDVVVRGDDTERECSRVHLIFDRDAVGVLQVGQSRLDQLRQVVALCHVISLGQTSGTGRAHQVAMRGALHVVVVRIRD